MLRRLAVVVATGLAAIGFGLAHAGSAAAATYTVCGFGTIVPIPGAVSCMTLNDAIAAAQVTPEADTIRMLPGSYCPIDLEGTFAQPIKFIGVGFAGVDFSGGPVSFSGPEASLTTITNDSLHCDSSVFDIEVNARVTSSAPMVFQNLTVDGTAGVSTASIRPASRRTPFCATTSSSTSQGSSVGASTSRAGSTATPRRSKSRTARCSTTPSASRTVARRRQSCRRALRRGWTRPTAASAASTSVNT